VTDIYRLYEPDELGPDGYPPAWHRQEGNAASSIKVLVRLAAGNRCVRCQHPYEPGEGEWSRCDGRCDHPGPYRTLDGGEVIHELKTDDYGESSLRVLIALGYRIEARWRILTVHHLDMNKANCKWWNLCALCQRCHLQIQGKVQMARVWPWEHSCWFKPYVAGYYASVYLGQELERPAVEARLDELLALERVA
jgi:hypothetical protein